MPIASTLKSVSFSWITVFFERSSVSWVTSSRMRLIGLEIPRNQTKALRLRSSVDHTVSQQQEKSPGLHREKCVFACPREALCVRRSCSCVVACRPGVTCQIIWRLRFQIETNRGDWGQLLTNCKFCAFDGDRAESEEPRQARKTKVRLILLDRDCPAYDPVNQWDKQAGSASCWPGKRN